MLSVHYLAGMDNRALRDLLLSEMKQLPGSALGVGNGWSGPKTLFDCKATDRLQVLVQSRLHDGPWRLMGWGNVLQSGDLVGWHDHVDGKNVWSGIYYPSTGGGPIEFEDGQRVYPEESRLILFPSALKHRVTADAARLSIAFNASK